jgi:hypothetical protein
MEFDNKNFRPTYRLIMGSPSFELPSATKFRATLSRVPERRYQQQSLAGCTKA